MQRSERRSAGSVGMVVVISKMEKTITKVLRLLVINRKIVTFVAISKKLIFYGTKSETGHRPTRGEWMEMCQNQWKPQDLY